MSTEHNFEFYSCLFAEKDQILFVVLGLPEDKYTD